MTAEQAVHQSGSSKKRRRPAKSCEQCRQRKVKCKYAMEPRPNQVSSAWAFVALLKILLIALQLSHDHAGMLTAYLRQVGDLEDPCGQCVRARASLFCTYSPETVRFARSTHATEKRGHHRSAVKALQPVHTEGRQRSPGSSDRTVCCRRTTQESANLSDQDVLEHPGQPHGVNGTAGANPRHPHPSRDPHTPFSDLQHSCTTDQGLADGRPPHFQESALPENQKHYASLSVTPSSPLLRLKHNKTRIFNHTHWSHTATKVCNDKKVFYTEADSRD